MTRKTSGNVVRLPVNKTGQHADAFIDLEDEIGGLWRATEICRLAADEDDAELMYFAIRQLGPFAAALKKKYYQLY
jgi:hypothetical protein